MNNPDGTTKVLSKEKGDYDFTAIQYYPDAKIHWGPNVDKTQKRNILWGIQNSALYMNTGDTTDPDWNQRRMGGDIVGNAVRCLDGDATKCVVNIDSLFFLFEKSQVYIFKERE